MPTKYKKIIPSEQAEQKRLVTWLSFHPALKNYYCKIDNEGKRSVVSGYNAKLMGLRPGASDLFIYYPTKKYHGLWIEMKRNRLYTKSERNRGAWLCQEYFIEQVMSRGYFAEFCFGCDHAISVINDYLRT